MRKVRVTSKMIDAVLDQQDSRCAVCRWPIFKDEDEEAFIQLDCAEDGSLIGVMCTDCGPIVKELRRQWVVFPAVFRYLNLGAMPYADEVPYPDNFTPTPKEKLQ
jgi:hypothetical protein